MSQEFAQPRREREIEEVEELPQAHTQSHAQVSDVDALLDDIDAVLESNATSFVRGFVQKGGQ